MKTKAAMTFDKLLSRSFGKESYPFWSNGPRGLDINDVRAYLESGGDVNQRSKSGDTLLHIAAWNGDLEIVQFLLAHGADINSRGNNGYTALHLAVDGDIDGPIQSGRAVTELPVARLLIEAGADESLRDDGGEIPRDTAVAYGKKPVEFYDAIPRKPLRKS